MLIFSFWISFLDGECMGGGVVSLARSSGLWEGGVGVAAWC
jgi:hypothetical protein